MDRTNLIYLYLNAVITSVQTLSEFICNSDNADFIAGTTAIMIDTEEKTDHDIDLLELTQYEFAPALIRECRNQFMLFNSDVIMHLEKFQLQGYHFENVIHSLKLENETFAKEIHFG